MDIVGALARGNNASTIYFVEYSHTTIERQAIQQLVDDMHYTKHIIGSKIKLLALESSKPCDSEDKAVDALMANPHLVGLIFENEDTGCLKTIILDEYVDLDIYLREFLQEDDIPPTPEEFLLDEIPAM